MPIVDARHELDWRAIFALLFAGWLATVPVAQAQSQPPTARRLSGSVTPKQVPQSYRTSQALYLNARDTHALMSRTPDLALLLDVRTTGEVVFSGIARPATRNIPYLIVDPDLAYDGGRKTYKLVPNPDFVKAVEMLVKEKGRTKDAPIILYCTVGERSAKAARLLESSGFSSVHLMVDGFDPDEPGEAGPGWKRAGLPWTSELTRDQLYVSPTM